MYKVDRGPGEHSCAGHRALATLRVLAVDGLPRLALDTHSSFLKAMLAVVMGFEACGTQEDLSQWETGELRTLELVSLTPLYSCWHQKIQIVALHLDLADFRARLGFAACHRSREMDNSRVLSPQ